MLVVEDEGIEFPCTDGFISLAVRSNTVSRFVLLLQLGFGFGGSQEFELGVGVLEGGRVPFLARRLILLIILIALAIKRFSSSLVLVKIASTTAIELAVEGVDT